MLIVSIFLHIHTDTQNVGSMKAGFFFPFACCYILNAYESVLCSSNLVRKYWMNKWINRWLNKGLSSNAMWWESRTSLPMAKWWIFTKARWSRKLNIWALQREGKTHKMWLTCLVLYLLSLLHHPLTLRPETWFLTDPVWTPPKPLCPTPPEFLISRQNLIMTFICLTVFTDCPLLQDKV